ncbi:MAG TPA: UDP-N-acetylglucosamine 2-epimerase [Pseudolysinimonas sp.]|nr:UDP-N-acetylglucosamine 2-epimerase [Pseudolysinimonas sp.]
MIIFIYGTTAEAIKIAPVARRLEKRGIPYESWLTHQHTDSLRKVLPELGLAAPTRIIADGRRGKPLKSSRDVLFWMWDVAAWMLRNIRATRKALPPRSIVVVHGDTITTVLGAFIARLLKVPSAHIEAGLRSGNWRHPFPEELDRRIVGKLARIHYTPSEDATKNLSKSANVVFTHGNTAIDAVLDQGPSAASDEAPFGVVLLHRFEFISNPQLVTSTFATLVADSPVPLRLITDAYSEHGLLATLGTYDATRLVAQPKLSHDEFITLLKNAAFIVTDSGGIQAEAALLGVPTLVHRKTTEQSEGFGANIVLSEWDNERLSAFLRDHSSYRRPLGRPPVSPSDVIVDDLVARGYGA